MSNTRYLLTDTDEDLWCVCPGDPGHSDLDRLSKLEWSPRLPPEFFHLGGVDDQMVTRALSVLDTAVEDAQSPDAAFLDQHRLDTYLLDAHRTYRQLLFLRGGG